MSNGYHTKATDWTFATVAEFDAQLDPSFHTGGIRLFAFESENASIGAYVLFEGIGTGAGLKFNVSGQTLKIGLEFLEHLARPGIGSELSVSLPRARVPGTTLQKVSSSFSLSDLHGCTGELKAVGIGAGISVGATSVTAVKNGLKLFECSRLGLEFGRLGLSLTNLQGRWHVVHAYTW
jgi:hypothetical protein